MGKYICLAFVFYVVDEMRWENENYNIGNVMDVTCERNSEIEMSYDVEWKIELWNIK
jgi:hypothetical protein